MVGSKENVLIFTVSPDIGAKSSITSMECKKRHYSMHTSLFLYVGNFILFCKLCHYIMQIVI